jgi:HlyD family secretion protein
MGSVVADSNRKTLQHLEGGVLKEILVKDGDYVKKGQPLLRLDPVRSEAVVAQLNADHYGRQAQIARLQAERDGKTKITYPAELWEAGKTDKSVPELIKAQDALFAARLGAHEGQLNENRQRIEQVRSQIRAYQSQISSNSRMLTITGEELRAAETLLQKGFERLPRVQDLRRRSAQLQGDIGELNARIAQSQEAMAQFDSTIANLKAQRQSEITNELQRLLTEESDYQAQINAAQDSLTRTALIAPQDGRIINIRIVTVGGVVRSGEPVMDIVPVDDEMVVEARVRPDDIDSVRPGLKADVRLLAYKQRLTPPVEGEVQKISADRLTDERTGESYYKAKVRLFIPKDKEQELTMYPGMPVEVFINTGSRRAIDYFISPVTDSWRRSFREE